MKDLWRQGTLLPERRHNQLIGSGIYRVEQNARSCDKLEFDQRANGFIEDLQQRHMCYVLESLESGPDDENKTFYTQLEETNDSYSPRDIQIDIGDTDVSINTQIQNVFDFGLHKCCMKVKKQFKTFIRPVALYGLETVKLLTKNTRTLAPFKRKEIFGRNTS